MKRYSLAHLSEGALLEGLKTNLARERDALALVLAHIAEVEAAEADVAPDPLFPLHARER